METKTKKCYYCGEPSITVLFGTPVCVFCAEDIFSDDDEETRKQRRREEL